MPWWHALGMIVMFLALFVGMRVADKALAREAERMQCRALIDRLNAERLREERTEDLAFAMLRRFPS